MKICQQSSIFAQTAIYAWRGAAQYTDGLRHLSNVKHDITRTVRPQQCVIRNRDVYYTTRELLRLFFFFPIRVGCLDHNWVSRLIPSAPRKYDVNKGEVTHVCVWLKQSVAGESFLRRIFCLLFWGFYLPELFGEINAVDTSQMVKTHLF